MVTSTYRSSRSAIENRTTTTQSQSLCSLADSTVVRLIRLSFCTDSSTFWSPKRSFATRCEMSMTFGLLLLSIQMVLSLAITDAILREKTWIVFSSLMTTKKVSNYDSPKSSWSVRASRKQCPRANSSCSWTYMLTRLRIRSFATLPSTKTPRTILSSKGSPCYSTTCRHTFSMIIASSEMKSTSVTVHVWVCSVTSILSTHSLLRAVAMHTKLKAQMKLSNSERTISWNLANTSYTE